MIKARSEFTLRAFSVKLKDEFRFIEQFGSH